MVNPEQPSLGLEESDVQTKSMDEDEFIQLLRSSKMIRFTCRGIFDRIPFECYSMRIDGGVNIYTDNECVLVVTDRGCVYPTGLGSPHQSYSLQRGFSKTHEDGWFSLISKTKV